MANHPDLTAAGCTDRELAWIEDNLALIRALMAGKTRIVPADFTLDDGSEDSVPQATWDDTPGFVVRIVKTPLDDIPPAIVWTREDYEADPADPDHAVLYHPDGRVEDAADFSDLLCAKPSHDGCIVLVNTQYPCPPEHLEAAQALVEGRLEPLQKEELVP